jgi:hypothetical protein
MIENANYTHPAWRHIPKPIWEMLVANVNKYNTFNGRVVRLGERIRAGEQHYTSRKGETELAKLGNEAVGDIFEAAFGEHFLRHFGPSLGVWEVQIETVHDWGIDFRYKGNDGKWHPGQLKFRSDGQTTLTHFDGLDGTVEEAIWKCGLSPSDKNACLIVTNANTILWKDFVQRWDGFVSYITPNESRGLYTDKKYTSEDAVRSLSICQLTNDSFPYWDSLRTLIATLP